MDKLVSTPREPRSRVVWLSGIAALVLFVGLAWYLSPLRAGALLLQFSFTPATFAAVIHSWSPEELRLYRSHLPVNFILLVCYGVFGWLLSSRTTVFSDFSPLERRVFGWLLPLAAAFDAFGNVLQWWLTAAPRFGVSLVYAVSGTCSALKWVLLLAFAGTVAYAFVRTEDEPLRSY